MTRRFNAAFTGSCIATPTITVAEWCAEHVRLPGSARSSRFDPDITPWTREVLNSVATNRIITFVKPVQGAGSVVGEAAVAYWLSTASGGDVQWNWENDLKASERWSKRIERNLQATSAVMERAPQDRHKWQRGLVMFPHCNLTVQGVWNEDNLSSDTIRFQINEEIHAWDSGRLDLAYGRTKAVWNAVILNISNASMKSDQLHKAFLAGTQQHWEVRCPGCGQFHRMHFAFDRAFPERGGLRWFSENFKLPDGSYNYPEIARVVRYQMPCGYEVRNTPNERRALSLSGRYSEPENKGAMPGQVSFTLSGVAVDYLDWVEMIKKRREAWLMMKAGDPVPFMKFKQEDECEFWDPEDRPIQTVIITNPNFRKSREGLADRKYRFFALDRQRGYKEKGEAPHWWLVIRDVLANGDSLLIFEGKIESDLNVIEVLEQHGCLVRSALTGWQLADGVEGVADSGDDTIAVYDFCWQCGIDAIKGTNEAGFRHPDGALRIFEYELDRPLSTMFGKRTRFPVRMGPEPLAERIHPKEPRFFRYSKHGIRERLHWLRSGGVVKHEIPGDVSADYRQHDAAEEMRERKSPKGEIIVEWVQTSRRNDLRVCECYIALLMDRAGLIASSAASERAQATPDPTEVKQ